MKDIPIITPYCIFNYNDTYTNTFLSLIESSKIILNKDQEIEFSCSSISGWLLSDIFYAISPMTRPIPVGMKLFCAVKKISFPYNTIDVEIVYDIFNLDKHGTYFMTYNQPVPNTVPLYLHKLGDEILIPSFDKEPPNNSSNWTHAKVSPIFVMTKKSLKNTSLKDLKFYSINGKCLPLEPNDDTFGYDPKDKKLYLDECLVIHNEIIDSQNPKNLLTIIDKKKVSKNKFPKIFRKISPIITTLIFIIFVLILFLIIFNMKK